MVGSLFHLDAFPILVPYLFVFSFGHCIERKGEVSWSLLYQFLEPFPLSHTPTNNVRYIAFSMSFNENKLRIHTYIKF